MVVGSNVWRLCHALVCTTVETVGRDNDDYIIDQGVDEGQGDRDGGGDYFEHDVKFDFVGHGSRRALPRRRRVQRSSRSSLFEERDEVHVLRLEPIAWARRGAYICRFFYCFCAVALA